MKKFTFIIAAIAMMVFMTPSLVAWGQTRAEVTDVMNQEWTGITGTSYSNFSNKAGSESDAVYAGNCAGDKSSIQLRSNNSTSGIVSTTSGGTVRKVTVSWQSETQSGRTLNVYGKNTAYSAASDLYGNNAGTLIGTIVKGTSTELTITDDYAYIGMRSSSGAMYLTEIDVEWETGGGSTPTTYTVTFDAGDGTFDGNNDFPNASNTVEAGTYTLPSANRDGYTFDGWTITGDANLYTGSYEVSGDVDFTAHYTENTPPTPGGDLNLTFDVSSNPGGWPTANSTTLTNYTYTLNSVDYTFALKNVKCNSGYLMMTSVAVLGLPAIEGYKLTKVVASNSSGCSTSTKVGISSSDSQANYIAGGEIQTWSTTSSQYTYTLTSTNANTMYYMYVTNKNAQVITLALTYAQVSTSEPSISGTAPAELGYTASSGSFTYTLDAQGTTGTVTATVPSGSWISILGANNGTVTFDYEANPNAAQRSETVTLSYAYGGSAPATTTVTVTQAGNPNLANIAALTAQTAGNYTVSLTDALVTYTNGTNAYLEDATGAVLLYHCNDNNLNLAVGDKITGTANVTYTVYNNLPEVTAFTLATGYTLTSGNTVTPAVVTIADLENNYTSYISRYVKIENATVASAFSNKNCTIEQNSSSIVLRDQNSSATLTSNVGDHVTVTAHPSIYSTTHQIAVYEQSQIVVAKVDPTITFNNGDVRVGQTLDLSTLFNSNSNGAVTYSITAGSNYATLTGSELTGTAVGSVTVKAEQAETTSYNAGDATATITVNPALVLSSIAVTTAPTKTTYNEGETFDPTGMVVTATYTDNSTDVVTNYTYSPDGTLNVTHTYVTISYTENSVTKTTTQAITVNEVVDYAKLPFEWDDFSSTPAGITNNSVGSYTSSPYFLKFDGTGDYIILKFNETPGTLTFDIYGNGFSGGTFKVQTSVDGQTYTDLTSYSSLNSTTQSESFNNLGENVRYIKWIYTNKSSGNVALGNIALAAYVAPGNSAPVWSELPTPTIAVNAEYELNLSTYVTGTPAPTITLATSVSTSLYEFENGLFMFQPTAAGTYQFTFTATNSEGTADATLTVTAAEVATYTLATSITSGRHYVIAATTSNVTKAMGGKNATKAYYNAIDASIDGNTITVPANSEIQEFVIVGPNVDGYYYIYDPVAGGYLYASSSSSNDLNYQTRNDANGLWDIDFTNGKATAKGTNTHNILSYNSSQPRFSCYSTIQTAIAFYEKNESDPQYDFYVDIAAWTVDENDPDDQTVKTDNWYFIASPIASPYTLEGTDMISGTYEDYDLYRLNNTTWENYNEHSDFTTLNNGTGYLYANSQDITLHFSGAINKFTTDNNANVKSLTEGWNLIGNPYNIPIFINKPYYRMNANGDDIETEDGITSKAIPACTGVVVKATDGESVTFSTSAPSNSTGNNGNIQIALAQNAVTRGGNNAVTLDNAIVSFNEGSQLQKFYFGTQNANIYIPQNGEEFAIANAEAQGEMPVNFVAAKDGEYTISVNAENVEMNYLHLIDNLTGANVDLLATPSYTFNAKTTDYASRFRLVFSANEANAENDNFAFISNGQIILNGANNNATLQVIDMMGRIVSTQQVNGNNAQMAPVANGVYVLQLINGNEVKTQKIVVK